MASFILASPPLGLMKKIDCEGHEFKYFLLFKQTRMICICLTVVLNRQMSIHWFSNSWNYIPIIAFIHFSTVFISGRAQDSVRIRPFGHATCSGAKDAISAKE